jgi:hypothetical protein
MAPPKTRLYADPDQTPGNGVIGTVRRVMFPDGSRARECHPFGMEEAIMFFDPFQSSKE